MNLDTTIYLPSHAQHKLEQYRQEAQAAHALRAAHQEEAEPRPARPKPLLQLLFSLLFD